MNKKKWIILVSSVMVLVLIIGINGYQKYKESCFGGNGQDCYIKSLKYEKFQLIPEAESFALKACHLGTYEGCLLYANGALKKGDINLVREYLFQACKLNKGGCHVSMNFEITQNNLKDALTMSGLACNEENDPIACFYLGVIKIKQEDHGTGLNLLRKSCDRQVADACYYLAGYNFDRKDLDGCLYYLNEGCKLGHEMSCTKMTRKLDWLPRGSFNDRL